MENKAEFSPTDFETLRQKYGNHSKVALALKISPDHYGRVRRSGIATGPLGALISLFLDKAKPDESKEAA
ncbi:MAG: hypothetical protein BA863_01045 [Desulfovibrio sp. S3730MH75]|nr:MAG: hypothetical protein BA863_01045 [Desulfovibrio sp. S3730MH75]